MYYLKKSRVTTKQKHLQLDPLYILYRVTMQQVISHVIGP